MRKIITIISISFFCASAGWAQAPTGKGNPGAKAAPPPAIGRAYGKVTDSAGLPMGEVSALLLKQATDTANKKKKLILLKGMETKANGEFNFEDLPIFT